MPAPVQEVSVDEAASAVASVDVVDSVEEADLVVDSVADLVAEVEALVVVEALVEASVDLLHHKIMSQPRQTPSPTSQPLVEKSRKSSTFAT
jgi:hypothetical protein